MTGISLFPPDLELLAFKARNGEFGWKREQVPQVVDTLRSAGLAILGGELWWIPDGASDPDLLIPQSQTLPVVYVWETVRRADEAWRDFVSRSAIEAQGASERWPTPEDLPSSGQVVYNLCWISEHEYVAVP